MKRERMALITPRSIGEKFFNRYSRHGERGEEERDTGGGKDPVAANMFTQRSRFSPGDFLVDR
jgi:hypothetical protein